MGNRGSKRIEIGYYNYGKPASVEQEDEGAYIPESKMKEFEVKVDQRKYQIVPYDGRETLYKKQLYNMASAFVFILPHPNNNAGSVTGEMDKIISHWKQHLNAHPLMLVVCLQESESMQQSCQKRIATYRYFDEAVGHGEIPFLQEVVRGVRDMRQIGEEHAVMNVKKATRH
mmetsp:Transcript_8883/g.13464  ORF Transcript_8883/g.13464 Transcript_8883/m.13464 type:complete len:172 (-) Transcript_8883:86-601(-)|eukprot:CAMPEP_0201510700 /NCGR_PEP_ID=MMETSP0161_2-20130828/3270_1 /ASSEMBLY_ACC=CAM_ASM_000251 /TAXON_ID=180227 /ORGANISM="Neoparamoeba aestuarina, Strain SoJaBio B1-5/56/2" /LENGTH=171 /DNA_ID=CAMNT_0047905911 /DNA_START=186 /DNA_END=701 /DNA_ORIENTATION=+